LLFRVLEANVTLAGDYGTLGCLLEVDCRRSVATVGARGGPLVIAIGVLANGVRELVDKALGWHRLLALGTRQMLISLAAGLPLVHDVCCVAAGTLDHQLVHSDKVCVTGVAGAQGSNVRLSGVAVSARVHAEEVSDRSSIDSFNGLTETVDWWVDLLSKVPVDVYEEKKEGHKHDDESQEARRGDQIPIIKAPSDFLT